LSSRILYHLIRRLQYTLDHFLVIHYSYKSLIIMISPLNYTYPCRDASTLELLRILPAVLSFPNNKRCHQCPRIRYKKDTYKQHVVGTTLEIGKELVQLPGISQ
jgi:hypothetical protein